MPDGVLRLTTHRTNRNEMKMVEVITNVTKYY